MCNIRLFCFGFFFVFAFCLHAQWFSEDKPIFRDQVISRLKSKNTEVAWKIAYDFQNAWDLSFTSSHQNMIHQIALTMQNKYHPSFPYFYHFFSYLAYSVAQGNLQRASLDRLLKINEYTVQHLNEEEYKQFLLGVNYYLARRYLSWDTNLKVRVPLGTYNFQLIDNNTFDSLENIKNNISSINNKEDLPPQNDWDSSQDTWEEDDWSTENDNQDFKEDDWSTENDNQNLAEDNFFDENNAQSPAPQYSLLERDYVLEKQNKYTLPPIKGPLIKINNTPLVINTPYDSFTIRKVSGHFLLKDRTFIGNTGVINWSSFNKMFDGATIQFGIFKLLKDHADFWTPHAMMTYGNLFSGKIEGVFEYRSTDTNAKKHSDYPSFTSNHANINIKFKEGKINYVGGIQLKGNRLYGTSISREMGTLKINDEKGNIIILKSEYFDFNDDLFSMDNGTITIIHHSTDSIFHKSVQAKFDLETQKLSVLRKTSTIPFLSSYFDMSLHIDYIQWNLNNHSIKMDILNGKDVIPAIFESNSFYDNIRYKKLGRFLDFHPINAAVFYAKKYGVRSFFVDNLTDEYNIDVRFAEAACKVLDLYGFADYNTKTREVHLYDKAFHFYNSSAQQTDFDNLKIPSIIADSSNAEFLLDSGQLIINGVKSFYLTTDFKTSVVPSNSSIKILKNRNIKFDGKVNTNDFTYTGKDYLFDYDLFIINMPEIDSIGLNVNSTDTLTGERKEEKLSNHITSTSGTLYIDKEDNKSGRILNASYPFFISDSEATVYFDGKEILNGAYDKSIRFIIPKIETDSLETEKEKDILFTGTFNSGGIFPVFEETLKLQNDRSLGFIHEIPKEGYQLYGTNSKTYKQIYLNNGGLRGHGKIDFLTTTVYSDNFIYYPNKVTTFGSNGVISDKEIDGISYPEAIFHKYKMKWSPRNDTMYLRNIGDPFKFYNASATLNGVLYVTSKGVFGKGNMTTRGAKISSPKFALTAKNIESRNSLFKILSSDPTKPNLDSKNVKVFFDLETSQAKINPEKLGSASLTFPYVEINTSIPNAVWDLAQSTIIMTKPEYIQIDKSYFYSTKPSLNSLRFNGSNAIYDIQKQELIVKNIPYITIADSKVIPKDNEITIQKNSTIEELTDAQIIIDTLNGYHRLINAAITIISKNEFKGSAWYELITKEDTFNIRFNEFKLEEVTLGKDKSTKRLMTVSEGEVIENDNFIISEGFLYKGKVKMYAHKKALELKGNIRLDISQSTNWIAFERNNETVDIKFLIEDSKFVNRNPIVAGMHYSSEDRLIVRFIEDVQEIPKSHFYKAKGWLSYDPTEKKYVISSSDDTNEKKLKFKTNWMTYADESQDIEFYGPIHFFNSSSNSKITITSSAQGGKANKATNEVKCNSMIVFNFYDKEDIIKIMANELLDIVERIEFPPSHEMSNNTLSKIANVTNEEVNKRLQAISSDRYVALHNLSKELEKSIVISNVDMAWSKSYKSWYNDSPIGVSNMLNRDINASFEGFLEFTQDETGSDAFNLFLHAAPQVWYFISYASNQLLFFSSDAELNQLVESKSDVKKIKINEFITNLGSFEETLNFISNFRLNYLDISEPYNLMHPTDTQTGEDSFETIKKEDDGFDF